MSLRTTLRAHWPEYLMEATELGLFMVSACVFAVLLFHPDSSVPRLLPAPGLRRLLIGIAMALTAVAIIYSPLGRRSGAHFNPSLTLTYVRLARVAPTDALFYVAAHFVGAVAGVALAAFILGRPRLAHAAVNYAATLPGPHGAAAAFAAELAISFVLMTVVLVVSSRPRLTRFTGLFAATLVATYITLEAPLSGMSMNPARSFGSAFFAGAWSVLWIYFLAPPLGMLLAAETYVRLHGRRAVACAKLNHTGHARCIFCAFWRMRDA
jgi:aquaporin Z